jgi:3-oxoacyl-[acyl-carrier-protein] synthase-3
LLEQPILTPAATRRELRTASILGLGHALPERVVTTKEIAARFELDESWFTRRTGIAARRYAETGQGLNDLACEAGAAALSDAGIAAADVDLVLVATMSADTVCPASAPVVAQRLGAIGAGAMDINAACTAWVSALSLAASQVETGRAEHVLVIGADVLSRMTNHEDRRTAAIFGDAAGATVVGPGDAAIGPVVLQSDGSLCDAIVVNPDEGFIRMDGVETFKAAVTALCDTSLAAAAAAGTSLENVDLVVLHQANGRILSAVGERLGLPAEKLLDYIGETGNTSAASIPLTLSLARADGRVHPGDRVLVSAVGAGFTSGAAVLEWGVR